MILDCTGKNPDRLLTMSGDRVGRKGPKMRKTKLASMLAVAGGLAIATSACSSETATDAVEGVECAACDAACAAGCAACAAACGAACAACGAACAAACGVSDAACAVKDGACAVACAVAE